MEGKLCKDHMSQSYFSEILKRAYKKGITDRKITVEKLIEDIKSDLLKNKLDPHK